MPTPQLAVLAGLGLGVVTLLATNWCWAAVEVDVESGVVGYQRGFLWTVRYVIPFAAVHVVEIRRLTLCGSWCVGTLSIAVYDSRPMRLRVPLVGRLTTGLRLGDALGGPGR